LKIEVDLKMFIVKIVIYPCCTTGQLDEIKVLVRKKNPKILPRFKLSALKLE
jgi:hypothetical protein